MSVNEEATVSMVDVLEEDEELESKAYAVLGACDTENCSYSQGYVKRQALYACSTCTPPGSEPAGICLACSFTCHNEHQLHELYTKRSFRCDCGTAKFGGFKCKLIPTKDDLNSKNKYDHNFFGLYCTCDRPYPDMEDPVEDEMIQCVVCEDWFHGRHLGCELKDCEELQEMVCEACMNKSPFLWNYAAWLTDKANHSILAEDQEGEDKAKSSLPASLGAGTEDKVLRKRTHKEAESPGEVECRLKQLVAAGTTIKRQGAVFWPYVWRNMLCTCVSCKRIYVEAGVPFLMDQSDTVLAYEAKGRAERDGRDPITEVLNRLDHVQQLEVIHEFNEMKVELKDFLQRFAKDGKVVTTEDIQGFFEELYAQKRRRMNLGQGYCSGGLP